MQEKLIEDWMDSASEREYQPIFCQALAAAGHTILHSTRHGPMELGKDVITRGKDGEVYGFQLKGNPRSRLTMSQWHGLINQINALIHHPVDSPLVDKPVYCVPTLVTNGDVDEEVQAAITNFNRNLGRRKSGPKKLMLISRGRLLDDFIKPAAKDILPTSFRFDARVLSLLSQDGYGMLPIEQFSEVLAAVFEGRETNKRRAISRIHGASLLGLFILRPWMGAENHLAKMFGLSLILVSASAKCIQSKLAASEGLAATAFLRSELYLAGQDLLSDAKKSERSFFYERSPLFEFAYHPQRICLLQSIFAAMRLCEKGDVNVPSLVSDSLHESAGFITKMSAEMPLPSLIVGEGQIPQLLVRYWYLNNVSAGLGIDVFMGQILNGIIDANLSEDPEINLPNPYYGLEETIEHKIKIQAGIQSDLLANDSFKRQAWFAMPLFGLLVRRNWKQIAKSVFPKMTKLIHKTAEIRDVTEFSKARSEKTREIGEMLDFPGEWNVYVERSRARRIHICDYMKGNLLPLLIFLVIFPYRASE